MHLIKRFCPPQFDMFYFPVDINNAYDLHTHHVTDKRQIHGNDLCSDALENMNEQVKL